VLGIFGRRTVCSCSERSANWSWPFTRAHERYLGATVTTVTCLKHPWSVRLYDPKKMSFVKSGEERKILRQLQANAGQTPKAILTAQNASVTRMIFLPKPPSPAEN
jgi:hypothetical protein